MSYVSYEEEEGLVDVSRKSYAPRPYNGVEARNFVTSMPLRRTDRDRSRYDTSFGEYAFSMTREKVS